MISVDGCRGAKVLAAPILKTLEDRGSNLLRNFDTYARVGEVESLKEDIFMGVSVGTSNLHSVTIRLL